MKASTVKTLGIATAVVAVGAFAATKFRSSGTRASGVDTPLLPTLEERVNDVATVTVEASDGTVTLHRSGAEWTLAEKGGYAAKPERVRELILALRDSRIVEEKTADPARFDKLGLAAPDAEDSRSKRVTLKDAGGETIASALIGNRRFGKGTPNQSPGAARPEDQYYVQPDGEGAAVLATGKLTVDARAVGWLEQQFLDVARDRIRAVRVSHPSGETVEVVRPDMEGNELELVTVPEGKEPKQPSAAGPFLDALSRMRFDDVKKAADVDWAAAEVTRAEFFTEHGLRVTVETLQEPKEDAPLVEGTAPQLTTWARFTVDVAPDEAPALAVAEVPEDPETTGNPESADTATDPADAKPPTVEELRREAAELGGPLEGWAFAVPSWKTTALRMPMETLVQDIPPPPEPEPEPEPEPAEVDPPGEESAGEGGDGAPEKIVPPPTETGTGGGL